MHLPYTSSVNYVLVLKLLWFSDKEAAAEFAKLALTEVNPRSSWRASKEFRLQLIEELAKRGLAEAIRRAGGEEDA